MLKLNQVLVVLTLFVAGSLGRSSPGEDSVGSPGAVDTSDKCKKDLLLIIDTSSSIEQDNFEDNVQPFLMDFVRHPYLNVNKHGTRIAIILFSSREKTRLVLKFNKEYDAEKIAKKIGNLKWDNVVGYSTRTEKALKIADEQVFTMNDPDNIRRGVQDIILLVTDGAPTNLRKSKINAQKLKNKKILIVGLAIGPKREAIVPKLKELATDVVSADFEELDKVIGTIISKSCVRPATCSCPPPVGSGFVRLKPGQSKYMLHWQDPQLLCEEGAPAVEQKTSTFTSPHMFPAGRHTITYDYTMKNGAKLVCVISVTVKDPLCGGEVFNSKSQVCCCGEIHPKQNGSECCGKFYHNRRLENCCDAYANRVAIGESCP